MITKALHIILLIIFPFCVISQNETSQWYFGNKAGLNFLNNPPGILTNSAMDALEGCASISNSNGSLLFYTKGDTIWNSQHQVMSNGTGLYGSWSSSQSALILKQPGNTNIYFVITADDIVGVNHGICYSVVDMNLAAGMGSVTTKNNQLYTPSIEGLCATRHCNGNDIWIVTHELNNAVFKTYLLTTAGINTVPVTSTIGTIHSSINGGIAGNLKFSPNGKKLGVVFYNPNTRAEIFDFNNSTGTISNSLSLVGNYSANYGCEFSPDGSKFYATDNKQNGRILQWNLCGGSNTAIISSRDSMTFSTSTLITHYPWDMQLAPNGKIYISFNGYSDLAVINKPNLSGAACNLVLSGQSVAPKNCDYGLPDFLAGSIKSYLTYTQDLACSTVSFSPPATVYQGTAGCSNVVNIVSGYQWLFGDPASGPNNSSTLSHPVHVYPGFGNYPVKLVISYLNSCVADTINQILTIGNPTFAVVQSTVSCSSVVNATINVSNGYSSGAYSYTWLPSSQSGSNAINLSQGIYTINIQSLGGSCMSTFTTFISPPIIISGNISNTISCTTATAQINVVNGSGNYLFSWSPGLQNDSIVTGLSPNIYTVTVNDVNNQCSFTQTVQITSLPSPSIAVNGKSTVCKGESVSLTATGADTYTWNTGSTNANITFTPNSTMVYTVVGTNTLNLCNNSKTIAVIVLQCAGIDEMNKFLMETKVYPNPVINKLFLESTYPIKISIFNQFGQLITEKYFEKGKNMVDVESYLEGIYFIRILENNKTFDLKFIKSD